MIILQVEVCYTSSALKLKKYFAVLVMSPSENEEPISMESIRLLKSILPTNINMSLRFMNVQKRSGSESGILTVALACDICFNPKNIFNEYVNSRSHFFACLQNNEIDEFQSISKDIQKQTSNVMKIE